MNRHGPRISLATLLLLLTILILAFSHFITSRELSATREELREFRRQYGVLAVDDPSRPHVLAYADLQNPWKWHLYLPEGKSYKLTCGVGNVPKDGVPDAATLQNVQETWVPGDGKNRTIFVSLLKQGADKLMFSIGGDGCQTVSQLISENDIYERSVFDVRSVGSKETFVANNNVPFVIFSQTEHNSAPATPPAKTATGVVVWLVPVDAAK